MQLSAFAIHMAYMNQKGIWIRASPVMAQPTSKTNHLVNKIKAVKPVM